MNFKVAISPGATLTEVEGKTVVFSKRTGAFFGLNDSAAQLLSGLLQTDLETTVKKYAFLYKIESELLVKDISEMVQELLQLKLLTKEPI